VDLTSGQVLLEKNANARLPMASTTKLMTALVIIEDFKPNEMVTVPKLNTHAGDAVVGLVPGDRLTVYNLLHGLLIESGSDTAITLAK
jgi:D-alanyl-D-alanine carboxypeptidase